MKPNATRLILATSLIALTAILVSCGASSFHAKRVGEVKSSGYSHLFVMMPSPDKELGNLVEHDLVSALGENGIESSCSYDQQQLHPERADTAVKIVALDLGADAVLFVLPKNYSASRATANSRVFLPRTEGAGGWAHVPVSGKLPDAISTAVVPTATQDSAGSEVGPVVPEVFELMLYDLASGKLVWKATSGVDWGMLDKPVEVSQQLAAVTVREMKKGRVIP